MVKSNQKKTNKKKSKHVFPLYLRKQRPNLSLLANSTICKFIINLDGLITFLISMMNLALL